MRAHVSGMVRFDLVVFPEPKIDGDLGLFGGMDPFSLEHLLSQGPLKALILPCVGKKLSRTVF